MLTTEIKDKLKERFIKIHDDIDMKNVIYTVYERNNYLITFLLSWIYGEMGEFQKFYDIHNPDNKRVITYALLVNKKNEYDIENINDTIFINVDYRGQHDALCYIQDLMMEYLNNRYWTKE